MIKFAVVGLGHIGKRHVEMIRRNANSELVAVCDVLPKEETGCELASSVPYFRSIEGLLSSGVPIDVVCICTPNGYHAAYAQMVLEAKIHVVLEKPIALTKHDAEKIVFKSIETSHHVFCVMQNRYSPPSVWLKDLVHRRILGDIYMVKADCFWNRDARYYQPGGWHGDAQLDGGTLFTQFSHFIDIMYWLFGDITHIKGHFADHAHANLTDFEDSGMITFDFVNGGTGCLNYSTAVWDKNFESSLTVIAENGTVKIAGQYMNEVVYCHVKDYTMPSLAPSGPPNDYGQYKGSAQNHHHVIQNVIEKLSDKSPITTNVLEGLKVVEIIERIYEVRDKQWKKQRQENNR